MDYDDFNKMIKEDKDLQEFTIQSVQKHIEYLTMFKLILDSKRVIDLDQSFAESMFMIKRYQDQINPYIIQE